MGANERREKTRELRAHLTTAPLSQVASNHLGKASYAWLLESKAATPYETAAGAAQTFTVIRKGESIGELNIARTETFLSMLSEQDDPLAAIDHWASQNGQAEPREPEAVAPEVEADPELVALLAPVQERYDKAKEETDRLVAELAKAREESNRLLAILKAAGIVPRAQYQKKPEGPKRQKQSKGSHISDERAMEILGKIKSYLASNPPALEDVPGSFTRPQIEKSLGLHHSQVSAAVDKLREQGYIRAAGLTTTPGGQKTNVFAVVA